MTQKGLRTVKVGSLELKWGILATEEFEAKARDYLKEKGIIPDGKLRSAWLILTSYVEADIRIYLMALEAATGKDRAEIISVIEDEEIPKVEVVRGLIESLALAEDPSRAVSIRQNWQLSDELQAQARKADTLMVIERAMEDLKTRAAQLGVLGSRSSNSDSSQKQPLDFA